MKHLEWYRGVVANSVSETPLSFQGSVHVHMGVYFILILTSVQFCLLRFCLNKFSQRLILISFDDLINVQLIHCPPGH